MTAEAHRATARAADGDPPAVLFDMDGVLL